MALGLPASVLVAGFLFLGTWQVQRRAWKLDLIERVEQRVHAAPVPAPGRERWPDISAAADEYRRVAVRGRFDGAAPVCVQAVTERGGGFWVLVPLRQPDGSAVIVNRGFVPAEARGRVPPVPVGDVTVTGLLRLTEPGGGFLRRNDPAADRWYSRDVQAIASAHGWREVAPYFIDAQAEGGPARADALPVAGLTVVSFHNNHLVYAITWYVLAMMTAGAAWRVLSEPRREPAIRADGGGPDARS